MKKINLLILFLLVITIFCSCNQKTIGDDSSDSTNISDSKDSVIIHKQIVFGGEELSQLEKDGIIPELKQFGIESGDFKYTGEYLQEIAIGDEWLDQPGDKLYLHWFNYENKEGDSLAIDKVGRLRRYYVNYSHGDAEIPEENIVPDDTLSDKAGQLCEQYLANWGDFKKYKADPIQREICPEVLTFDYVDNISDCVDNILSVSFFGDGRIYQISAYYSDLAPGFSHEKFDKFADEWFAKNLPERYNDLAEYKIISKAFNVVNDKIYGSYAVSCKLSDGAYDCIGIVFEEPQA